MTKLADLIWKNAELLRGAFKENEYRKVILPFTILRRLDCVLAPSRGYPFFNISSFTLREVAETPDDVRDNLEASHNRRRRTRLHRRANRLPGRAADGIKEPKRLGFWYNADYSPLSRAARGDLPQ